MRVKLIRCALLSAAVFLLAADESGGATIISNNFDGNDGNDIGGTFGIVSNGIESSDTTDASTGLISFTGNNATVGFSAATSFDAQAFSSLTVTWVIDSITKVPATVRSARTTQVYPTLT